MNDEHIQHTRQRRRAGDKDIGSLRKGYKTRPTFVHDIEKLDHHDGSRVQQTSSSPMRMAVSLSCKSKDAGNDVEGNENVQKSQSMDSFAKPQGGAMLQFAKEFTLTTDNPTQVRCRGVFSLHEQIDG